MNASASALAIKPAPHQLAVTRGAVYLLELALQDMGPCTTPAKTVAVGKLWEYVRSLNDRLIKVSWESKPVDFEKPVLPKAGETDLALQERLLEKQAAAEAWMAEPQILGLSDKRRDLAREIFKWVVEHQGQGQGKSTVRLGRTTNLNLLIEALGIVTQDDDTSEEE